jgi:hypothetical protein
MNDTIADRTAFNEGTEFIGYPLSSTLWVVAKFSVVVATL